MGLLDFCQESEKARNGTRETRSGKDTSQLQKGVSTSPALTPIDHSKFTIYPVDDRIQHGFTSLLWFKDRNGYGHFHSTGEILFGS